jgi:hypothetical protein
MLEEIRIVFIVYISALVPIYLLFIKFKQHSMYRWLKSVYLFSLILCALGWEISFTYGLFDGFDVNERRSLFMSTMIPMDINWLVNSLADAGTICIGGILILSFISKFDDKLFLHWNWNYFLILMLFTLSQNIFVEMFLYFDQISIGKPLSWAPFSPFGASFNPELININNRSIQLQTQMPWIIMTPILYAYSIVSYRRIYRDKN